VCAGRERERERERDDDRFIDHSHVLEQSRNHHRLISSPLIKNTGERRGRESGGENGQMKTTEIELNDDQRERDREREDGWRVERNSRDELLLKNVFFSGEFG